MIENKHSFNDDNQLKFFFDHIDAINEDDKYHSFSSHTSNMATNIIINIKILNSLLKSRNQKIKNLYREIQVPPS